MRKKLPKLSNFPQIIRVIMRDYLEQQKFIGRKVLRNRFSVEFSFDIVLGRKTILGAETSLLEKIYSPTFILE